MKEEIVGGLKNALERGSYLEQAVQSFINAGYNAAEIRDAAALISQGATPLLHPEAATPAVMPVPPVQTPQKSPSAENLPRAPAPVSLPPQQPQPIQQQSFNSMPAPRR